MATLDAVLAVVRPVVECNRKQIDNGRTYLREMVFGDPDEPHHRDALALALQTEEAIAELLQREPHTTAETAATLAHIVSAIMFLSMAAGPNLLLTVDEIMQDIRTQVRIADPLTRKVCATWSATSSSTRPNR